MDSRPLRAGGSVEDHCRACKIDRRHTVIVVDQVGRPLRTQCDFCGSQHNYRGVDDAVRGADARPPSRPAPGAPAKAAFELVTPRECMAAGQESDMSLSPADLELLIRRVVREEAGVSAVVPADKWRGGTLVLRPGTPGLQEKTWPIETFFHKVVMIRNRLRTLEQQVNASDLPDDAKVKLQSYVTGCYGSLTSFNVLFADEEDGFKGSGE